MAQGGVGEVFLLRTQQIVVAGPVGMGRTHIVLQRVVHVGGAADERGQVLHVEVGQHAVHLLLGHAQLLPLAVGGVAGPRGYLEVVGEIAHERHGGSDGVQASVAQGCGGQGECAALAGSLGEDVGLLHRLARAEEVDGSHGVHEGAAVVVMVFRVETEHKPVAVGVGVGRTVVDELAAGRHDEFHIAGVVVTAHAPGVIGAAVVAVVVDDGGIGAGSGGLGEVGAGDALTVGVAHRAVLEQVHLAAGCRLAGNLGQCILRVHLGQVGLGFLPEGTKVVLHVGGGDDVFGVVAEDE